MINVMLTSSYVLFDIYEDYVIIVPSDQAAHEVTGQLTERSETHCRAELKRDELIINLVEVTVEIHASQNYLTVTGVFISPYFTVSARLFLISPQKSINLVMGEHCQTILLIHQ